MAIHLLTSTDANWRPPHTSPSHEHALHPHTAHSTHTPLPTLTVSLRRYLHYEPACAPRKHAFLVYVSPVHYDALGVPPPP